MTQDEFNAAMAQIGYIEKSPTLALAVSGGGDSMALLLLARDWAAARGGRVVALTVDHGLRSESAAEAAQVGAWCEALGTEHHILTWKPPVLTSAIQAQARDARYALLAGWCHRHHVLHLLAGHHQGDQMETLLFRLARGSGVDGLASMPAVGERMGVQLMRPLLGITKEKLLSFLREKNQGWIEDPSNQNPDYTRVIIRSHLAQMDVGTAAIELAENFASIRNLLENKTASELTKVVSLRPEGYGLLLEKPFCAMEKEVALRSLAALVQTVSGQAYAPRTEKLERMFEELAGGKVTQKRSFAGCIFQYQKAGGRFIVYREPAAIASEPLMVGDVPALWDGRFMVNCSGGLDGMSVRALGKDGAKQLADLSKRRVEKPVLATLPSFWHLERLVAVPHIGFMSENHLHLTCTARLKPAKMLAGAAFFSMNRNHNNSAEERQRRLGPLRAAADAAPRNTAKMSFLSSSEHPSKKECA